MSRYDFSLPHLILGGTTKAASSSLFSYLAAHPDVCPATLKETRFFLDSDYPVVRLIGTDPQDYARLFAARQDEQYCLEATPDYLHATGTAERIARLLPDVRLLFILREPVSRLVSWYRFARQLAQIPQDLGFDDYVRRQIDAPIETGRTPQPLRALRQGRYSDDLAIYYERFPGRVMTLWFEELCGQPRSCVAGVARFAGLDADFYRGYSFDIVNRTADVRSARVHGALVRAGRTVRSAVHRHPAVRSALRGAKRLAAPAYRWLNEVRDSRGVEISAPTRRLLDDYYRDQPGRLQQLTGSRPPWGEA